MQPMSLHIILLHRHYRQKPPCDTPYRRRHEATGRILTFV